MGGQDLPDAEMDVLSVLVRTGEATARQIREALERTRPLSHGAVCTLLRRLEDKNLVHRRKGESGKAFVYQARGKPQHSRRKLFRGLRERVFGGSSMDLIATLFDAHPPTREEIQRLEQMVDELKARLPRKDKP